MQQQHQQRKPCNTLFLFVLFIHSIVASQVAVIDLTSTHMYTGHVQNDEPHYFVFEHAKQEYDLFIRVEVNDATVEQVDLYLLWNETLVQQLPSQFQYDKHYSAHFPVDLHPAAKLRKFDLAYNEMVNTTGEETTRPSIPIRMQLVLGPTKTAASRTYTIRMAYQLTLIEGAVLFIGYAFFTFCCFLVVPCFCLGCAFTVSIARKCLGSSAWWLYPQPLLHEQQQQQMHQHNLERGFWQDTYSELISILQQIDGHHYGNCYERHRVTPETIESLAKKMILHDLKLIRDMFNQRCLVCLEDFEQDAMVRVLPCKHMFHSACIDAWLFSTSDSPKQACLLCKNPI